MGGAPQIALFRRYGSFDRYIFRRRPNCFQARPHVYSPPNGALKYLVAPMRI
jgi:hypothetical protein